MSKKKIAILGGGMGALAAAWEIVQSPNWQSNFEIDVYTLGWRLGGKCASSRNEANQWRNEEHGLHVLGGFYHNTFEQLRPLYAEWNKPARPSAIPFDKAFFGHPAFSIAELRQGQWRQVRVNLPEFPGEPGIAPEPLTSATVLARILEWTAMALGRLVLGKSLLDWDSDFDFVKASGKDATDEWRVIQVKARGLREQFQKTAELVRREADRQLTDARRGKKNVSAFKKGSKSPFRMRIDSLSVQSGLMPIQQLTKELQFLSTQVDFISGADWHGVLSFLGALSWGITEDDLFSAGFDSINAQEAQAWLAGHFADAAGVNCPLFQAAYHYAFAYIDGDPTKKAIAAGSGIRGLLRMLFTYHGSVFVHMGGGMGEIIAVPYYEVLRQRGVRFHFFHRVVQLHQTAGEISSIDFSVQADCVSGSAAYDPLVSIPTGPAAGRRCWPKAPLANQLSNGNAIQGVDLESWFASECIGAAKKLNVRTDFDLCLLALPPSILKLVTPQLGAANPAWAAMLNSFATTPTIAAQLWRSVPFNAQTDMSADGLLTGFDLPHSTWADVSFLHKFEEDANTVATLSILCGPYSVPPASENFDCNFPVREQQRADLATTNWLNASMGKAFKSVVGANGAYDQANEYFRFVRANTDPVSLYVLTPPGSVQHRLRCDQSGFSNLFLAGDWTRNNLDMGAVESAVMAGRLCARAICGSPIQIYGEYDVP